MHFRKKLITGVLALSMVVGAGAASASAAADTGTTKNTTYWTFSTQQNASLQALLQQWARQYQAGTGTKDQTNSGSANKTTSGQAGTGTSNTTNTNTSSGQASSGTSQSAYANQVITLVNQERAKAGVKPLAADKALSSMALDKAKDMYNKGYFDHTSPTYGSPFDMMKQYGIQYTYAGENIAKGQKTPQEVMNAWMNSPGHKQNILSPNYTKIGVAYYNGEWVQEFIAN